MASPDRDPESLSDAVKHYWLAGNGCFDPEALSAVLDVDDGRRNSAEPSSEVDHDGITTEEDNNNAALSSISIRDFLNEQWKLATKEMVTSKKAEIILKDWFDRLCQMHSEDTRHYHTMVHLLEMIQYLNLLHSRSYTAIQKREDLTAVWLAVFFHDAVYNARSATNEEDSAKLFETFAEEVNAFSALKTTVVDFILATKNHKVEQEASPSSALALFLDLDMAVLGKQPTAYREYAALIRQEYAFVPHDEYCRKRADVLESFLQQQPAIYATPVMHRALEDQARANLRHEIESLRKGVIPGSNSDANK